MFNFVYVLCFIPSSPFQLLILYLQALFSSHSLNLPSITIIQNKTQKKCHISVQVLSFHQDNLLLFSSRFVLFIVFTFSLCTVHILLGEKFLWFFFILYFKLQTKIGLYKNKQQLHIVENIHITILCINKWTSEPNPDTNQSKAEKKK